jgi:hypothetical protein
MYTAIKRHNSPERLGSVQREVAISLALSGHNCDLETIVPFYSG